MRIAFIGDRLGLATGGNLYIARLAEELKGLGAEVTLITLTPPRDIPWSRDLRLVLKEIPFSFGEKPGPGRWSSFFRSRLTVVQELKGLVREGYDVLYSVGGPSNLVNHLCRKGPYPPRISVAVIHHLFRQDPWWRFLLKAETYGKPFQTFYHLLGDHLAKGFKVVTVSEFWRNKLVRRGFASEAIVVIPNGADWQDWPVQERETAKKTLGLSGFFVLYTSPLRLNKGILNILQALKLLVSRHPNLMVLTSGVTDRRSQAKVTRFLRNNGLEGHFRYAGILPRKELPLYYSASDVVVLASLEEEGWGVTLLEGMMSGRAVICSPKGAMPELVGENGLVLEKNTPGELAQALERLINEPDLKERLEKAGPLRARSFSFRAAAQAHLEHFQRWLEEG